MVRGYHEYQAIWSDPYVGEELIYEREVGIHRLWHSKKKLMVTFGLLAMCLEEYRPAAVFIRRGGRSSIKCLITGSRRHSSDLLQGGLEIPCILIFTTKCAELRDKTKKSFGVCVVRQSL